MSLETGNFISDLVITNPTYNDPKSQGDDHLRLIKKTLKTTFPNITGAVNVSHTQLNQLAVGNVLCFPGMITLYAGTIASIPTGWKLCNGVGSTTTGTPIPDLRNRFVVGAGQTYAVGATGGSTTHGHSATVAGHALTVAQMPAHRHGLEPGQAYSTLDSSPNTDVIMLSGSATTTAQQVGTSTLANRNYLQSVGGGQAHAHGATVSTTNHLPPYYSLAYIIKE